MTTEEFAEKITKFTSVYGYTLEEALRLRENALDMTKEKGFLRYIEVIKNYPEHEEEFIKQFSKNRSYSGRLLDNKMQEGKSINKIMEDIILYPMSFNNLSLWFIYILTELSCFCNVSDLSKSGKIEESLTGLLIGINVGRASEWKKLAVPILSRFNYSATLEYLDLQINKREPATGGDTLIMIEWKNENNKLEVIPLVLQSKRYSHLMVGISQKNSDGTYQFHVLRSRPCPSAYIVFNNRSDGIIESPIPPLVRDANTIPNDGLPKSFNAIEKSLTLGTFILNLIENAPHKYRFPNASDALASILPEVNPAELSNVIVFSTEPNAQQRFQQAWEKILKDINIIKSKLSEEDLPRGFKFGF